MKKLQPDNPVMKHAEQIRSSINRQAASADLLTFSETGITLRPVDFNEVIHKAADASQLIMNT
jgi:hypothetical protein